MNNNPVCSQSTRTNLLLMTMRWTLTPSHRHIFRESNKAADTHANWLMDNGDSGPGAQ